MIDIQKQEQLRQFVEQEIFVCQTALVEEALRNEWFTHDDIINVYRQFTGEFCTNTPCSSCSIAFEELDSETRQCRECYDWSAAPQEVYEWWVISDGLELQLKLKGEPILSNEYGSWWGRTCTGQAVYIDDVIQEIYNELLAA